ncbi:MAG: SIS domain-containing protein [Chloroflexota bacterium]|nr:SIS domain-containing protein [Chloroflexota bacterium]
MSQYFDDVRGQPAALRALVARLGSEVSPFAEWAGDWRRAGRPPLVLTGMGASLFAAEAFEPTLVLAGLQTRAVATSDLVDFEQRIADGALVVALSQSGESTEIKELLAQLDPARVHAITNQPDSPLGMRAGSAVNLALPPDRSVAVKTYAGSVVALAFLAAELLDTPRGAVVEDVDSLADEIEAELPAWDIAAAEIADTLRSIRSISFIGWRGGIATAREAALLMKEAARTPAEGMSAAQFRHGAVELVDQHHATFVLVNATDGVPDEDRIAYVLELRALPGFLALVGRMPSNARAGDPRTLRTIERRSPLGSVADMVPLQLLAGHLAERSGFEAGEFRNTTPVIRERPKGSRRPANVAQG